MYMVAFEIAFTIILFALANDNSALQKSSLTKQCIDLWHTCYNTKNVKLTCAVETNQKNY